VSTPGYGPGGGRTPYQPAERPDQGEINAPVNDGLPDVADEHDFLRLLGLGTEADQPALPALNPTVAPNYQTPEEINADLFGD